ncbi:MAG: amino acid permease [Aeriscardovia sp.]|nr:amino acid permease [Aeriscardovia sp.]
MKQKQNGVLNVKKLTFFGFFAMTASMVMTIDDYPSVATAKFACVFFSLLAGLCWFLPTALISAEMASVEGWSEGGVFGWVGNALHSERLGFLAVFFQWFQVTVCFVTMCYFIIGVVADAFNISIINDDPTVKFILVLLLFAGISFFQLGGTQRTTLIAKWGFTVGVLGSTSILFILAIIYWIQGNPLAISFSSKTFFPDFHQSGTLTIFATFILMYAGIEASSSHINELEKAEKNYPLTVLSIFALAIIMDSLGGVSIASVVPQQKLSMDAGMYQALRMLICHDNPHLGWLATLLSLLLVLGLISEISSWAVGPAEGLQDTASYGMLPKWICTKNDNNVPTHMLLVQFFVVALWAAILTFSSGSAGNMAYLITTTLTSLIYLCCYVLMYLSYFRLIFVEKELKRTYNVPGGMTGKIIVGVVGFVTSIFAFIVSFIPMASLPPSQGTQFVVILTYCFIIAVLLPIFVSSFRRKFLKKMNVEDIRVLHFRLMWHRVPHIMQEAVLAARQREGIQDINGQLVQTITDENGNVIHIERSESFKESGF